MFDYADRVRRGRLAARRWLRSGELRSREDVVQGDIEQFPEVLLRLFHGENTGKLVLAVDDGELEHDLSHRFEAESASRTLALLGEKWTLLILREAFFGVRRYGQLVRNLGIPRPTLSTRLRTLVDAGLLERMRYATEPDRHEYRLTRAGIDLFPSIVASDALGRRASRRPAGAPT